MARTLNPATHAVRRDAFIDVAQSLIQTRGYEQMTVQDLLDRVDASRGAFYHYFDSKEALLAAVIERFVDQALVSIAPIVADPTCSAPEKLASVFAGIGSFKSQRKEFLIGLLEIWLSDHNAVVRERFRREAAQRLAPLLETVIAQGIEEGSFSAASAPHAARVFVTLLLGLNEVATRLFLDRQGGRIGFDEVQLSFAGFSEAFERILGARPGSLQMVDPSILHEWFD